MTVLTNIGRLFTSTGRGTIERAALVIEGERISWLGPESDLDGSDDERIDAGGGLVTAGLVDAHTHPVYAGDRLAEISMRTAGATYPEIAASGGGITSTVQATRAAGDLETVVSRRLARWLRSGTTTVEAKTGYHLTESGELGAVGLLSRLDGTHDLPRLCITFLGAHAVPEEFAGRQDDFVQEVCRWSTSAAAAGAEFTDVFCDEGYFTVEQSRKILEAGTAAGMKTRIHADELARTGGSQLAAEIGAVSADHLLQIDTRDIAALAGAGVVATLAPITAMSMGKLPPARELLEAGVMLALGTDHNPGTSGLTDMTIAIAAAVATLGISVDEALVAATSGGASSLARSDIGRVEPSALADLVLWDADHEGAFAWAWGLRPLKVWRGGELVVL